MPEKKRLDNLTLYGVRLLYRNFAGRAQQFNEEGNRNFNIILDPELADKLAQDGWNVKTQRVREEGDIPDRLLAVKVNFKSERPPKVVMIAGKNRVALGPDEVAVLDFADLGNVDVTLNPYPWEMSGKTGITAYLKTCYATLNQDELEMKYGDDQQSALPFGLEATDGVNDNIDEADGEDEDDEHAGLLSQNEEVD